jgi:hypothetical protein
MMINKLNNIVFSTLLVSGFILSTVVVADIDLSAAELSKIQNSVDSMSVRQLNQRMSQLNNEKSQIEAGQNSTQSPSANKNMQGRLAAINAELSAIQRALVVLAGVAAISSVTSDDYNDDIPPVITVNGTDPVTTELGAAYTDAGATANDANHGNTSVTSSGTVDTNLVGTYTITYTAVDLDNNTATATRTVNVTDTTDPVVSVTGASPATVELGGTYTEYGATASDASGAVTAVASGTVNTATLGAYTVTYTATDASGNAGTATRTVNVTDTTNPTINIVGAATTSTELGGTYVDAGVELEDLDPRTITLATTSTVNEDTLGSYTVTYTATDASGNAATATRTVNVTDTTGPIINIVGAATTSTELGGTYVDAGVELEDFDPRSVALVTTSTVNEDTLGSYTVTYQATDTTGNASTATRTVNVTDTTAPTFVSKSSFTVDEGVTAVGFVVANDLDPRTITFTISSSVLAITKGGALTFIQPADYESQSDFPVELPYDGSTYDITATVTATDASGNAGTQTITVSIRDVGGLDDNTNTGTGTNTNTNTNTSTGTGTGT